MEEGETSPHIPIFLGDYSTLCHGCYQNVLKYLGSLRDLHGTR